LIINLDANPTGRSESEVSWLNCRDLLKQRNFSLWNTSWILQQLPFEPLADQHWKSFWWYTRKRRARWIAGGFWD
jgi:hypothetical protein